MPVAASSRAGGPHLTRRPPGAESLVAPPQAAPTVTFPSTLPEPRWGVDNRYLYTHCVDMTIKRDKVLHLRVTERQRTAYERAAALSNTTVTAFVTGAADERADHALLTNSSMRVPSEVFDGLLAMLDQPGEGLAWMDKVLADQRFTNA